jgi:hypothetical protein
MAGGVAEGAAAKSAGITSPAGDQLAMPLLQTRVWGVMVPLLTRMGKSDSLVWNCSLFGVA